MYRRTTVSGAPPQLPAKYELDQKCPPRRYRRTCASYSLHGWATGTALAGHLSPAPAQTVRGYPEWKDKVATPALQEYYSGAIGLNELRHRLEKDGNLVLARYQR